MAKKKNAAEKRREQEMQRRQNRISAAAEKIERRERVQETADKEERAKEPLDIPTIRYRPRVDLKQVRFDAPFTVRVEMLSPFHFGSGRADIHVDADVVHDAAGLPYIPAKRFKGLLYESGLEVAEMAEQSGLDLFDKAALDAVFQRGCRSEQQLILSNLHIADHEVLYAEFKYLEEKYPSVFRCADVLDEFASLRWQTKINRDTGVAEATSLHNMRAIEAGQTFFGEIRLVGGDIAGVGMLALAMRNLSQAGLKRTRGFGRLGCTMEQAGKDVLTPLLDTLFKNSREKEGKRACTE